MKNKRLLWAAGIAPWKGGVFVSAPPDIWYLKDTDGDFRADVRRKVYTGFGTQNQQAMVNNLAWGLDHQVYASKLDGSGRSTTGYFLTSRGPVAALAAGRDASGNPEVFTIGLDGQVFRQRLDGNGLVSSGYALTTPGRVTTPGISAALDALALTTLSNPYTGFLGVAG